MAWIQVHQQLKDHRKLLAAADELEIEPAHMLGLLISFWLWALDNAPSGSLQGISDRMIARAAQWNGDPGKFVEAIASAGLLDTADDGSLSLHDWYEYTGKLIEQREAEKNRSRRRRAAAAAPSEDDRKATAGRPPDDQQTTAGRVDQSRVDQSREENINNPLPPKGGQQQPVPYAQIVELYHTICTSYPQLRGVEGNRQKQLAARWKKYKTLDTFKELFEKAEASDFLKGENDRGWAADFDWLIKPSNMSKVLEGKYDNDKMKGGQSHGNDRANTGGSGQEDGARSEAALSGFTMADS